LFNVNKSCSLSTLSIQLNDLFLCINSIVLFPIKFILYCVISKIHTFAIFVIVNLKNKSHTKFAGFNDLSANKISRNISYSHYTLNQIRQVSHDDRPDDGGSTYL
jgi:hypothetical protein